MNQDLLNSIEKARQYYEKAALVTVIATHGSTPRKAGSKMLVCPDGQISGSIGGGCAEAEAKIQAISAMDQNRSFVYSLSLNNDIAAEEGMVCGGSMDVFIQVI